MTSPPLPDNAHEQDGCDNAPIRLEEFLPYRLNQLASEVSQSLAQAYGEAFGISVPEWRILATLGQFGMVTARDIGTHSRMHKTMVSRAVATLERRGLIVREANQADLREAFLSLTPEGKALYRKIVPLARGFAADLCQDLSPEDLARLNILLDRLSERVRSFGQQSSQA